MSCSNNLNAMRSAGILPSDNYKCLKRGIGVGKNMPYDPKYSMPYTPYDKRKWFCGKESNPVPTGYEGRGTNPMCFWKGVGVGKRKKAEEVAASGEDSFDQPYDESIADRVMHRRRTGFNFLVDKQYNKINILGICVINVILNVILMYILNLIRPNMFSSISINNKRVYNYKKIIGVYIIMLLITLIISDAYM